MLIFEGIPSQTTSPDSVISINPSSSSTMHAELEYKSHSVEDLRKHGLTDRTLRDRDACLDPTSIYASFDLELYHHGCKINKHGEIVQFDLSR